MKKFIIGLLVVAVLVLAATMLIRLSLLAKKHQSKKLGKQRSKSKEPEKAGEAIKDSDYSNTDNWLAKPTEITSQADVFMLYPTAYAQKNENSSPVAKNR